MILAADQATFDQLHPFSFVCDREGRIAVIGRSLKKLFPHIHVGSLGEDHFAIAQPAGFSLAHAVTLRGEVVVLECLPERNTRFRGYVIEIGGETRALLFVLKPVLTSLSDISRLNLTMPDFEPSEPIIDFLLFMQGQISNQAKLREAKATLEWENRVSKLLLAIALATDECDNEREIYRTTLTAVCSALEWEFGHVFNVINNGHATLISGGVCANRSPERLMEFESVSRGLQLSIGEGLPGKVAAEARVVWVKNVKEEPLFIRKAAAANLPHLTGVGVPIFENGQVIAVLEFFAERPISDSENMRRFFDLLSIQLGGSIVRQRAERAAREHLAGLANAAKMATLGELAAGVAHEINNPLHTLTLTSHLLRRLLESGRLSPSLLTEQLEKLDKATHRMSTIIGALKAFSRDSTGDPFQPTSIRALIQDTLSLSSATLHAHHVDVSVSDVPEAWSTQCRPSQIAQVLLNLLSNAFDAVSNQDESWIRIEATDEGNYFTISVIDSGPGIPDSVAEKIMTPFFTTKPPGKGTGLGLSISSTIMSDHGGGLSLDRSGPHTRFVVALPKHRATPTRETRASGGHPPSSDKGTPLFYHHLNRTTGSDWTI